MTSKPLEEFWEPDYTKEELCQITSTSMKEWQDALPLAAVAIDCETTGLEWQDRAFAVTCSWSREKSFYLEVGCTTSTELDALLIGSGDLVMHNAKFDLMKMQQFTHRVYPFECTDTLARLVFLTPKEPKSLKWLTRTYLDLETDEEEVLRKVRRKLKIRRTDGYHLLPRKVLIPYACKDAEFTWALWDYLSTIARPEVMDVYAVEKELIMALVDIENAGMGADEAYIRETFKELGDLKLELELRLAEMANKPLGKKVDKGEFNPNSVPQLVQLFQSRGYKVESTSRDAVKELEGDLPEILTELRRVSKLWGTYFKGLKEECVDGIFHPNFNVAKAATGRMSSSSATNE